MLARSVLSVILLVASACSQIDATDVFREESVTIASGELAGRSFRYRIFVPEDQGPDEKLPVVLFLHGAGERGNDNRRQLKFLPERMLEADYRKRFRSIVVAPQCPRGVWWVSAETVDGRRVSADGPMLDLVQSVLDRTLEDERCDEDRIYLTGLSMGGYGTWHMAARSPERFAAAAPICGGGSTTDAAALVDLPMQAWHGAKDRTVPKDASLEMVRAVRDAGGICHYVELPGVGHASWHRAYSPEGLLEWMFRQRRGQRTLGRVVACDQAGPRILVLDLDRPWAVDGELDESVVVWEWRGEGLSSEQRKWFATPDEVKPHDDGTTLWVTASGGGVFKIRLADKKLLFAAKPGGNPHSATELPDGSVVVASSTGNRLTRYPVLGDAGSRASWTFELSDAHGVHWDSERQRLFALGGKELVSFQLGRGGLREERRWPLPVTEENQQHERHGGHDLSPWAEPGEATRYLVTDMERVFVFDPDAAEAWSPFEPLPVADHVKAIGAIRPAGPFVGLQATTEWWSDRLLFVDAQGERVLERRLPGGRVYKFRPFP